MTLQTPVTHDHLNAPYTITRAYQTIQDWVDDRRGKLVAENRREVGVLYNDGPFTNDGGHVLATIDGSKTDATHFMWLTVAADQRHRGIAGTGVVLDGANTTKVGLRIRDHYTRVEGVELRRFRGANGAAAVEVREARHVLLTHLLIHDFADDGHSAVGIKGAEQSDFTVRNCFIYDGDTAGIRTSERGTATIENCTIFGMAGRGVYEDEGRSTVRNTMAVGNPRGDFAIERGKQSHNLSSDDTAAGPGSLTHKNPFAQFVSLTPGMEDLHLKAGADALGAGVDLSAFFTEDIDGDPRSGVWDIGADHATPVAEAGPNVYARTGVPTALDGSDSYDPHGHVITFQWSVIEAPAGSMAIIEDPFRPNPQFIPDVPGTYVFELVVHNGQAESRPDRMTLTAFAENAPPNARAGRDQYARVGRQVHLDGRGSADPEQAVLSFQWSFQSAPPRSRATLALSDSPTPVLTPDVQGMYVLTLRVSDGVLEDADTMRVFASRSNVAPHANAGPDQAVQGVQEVTLDGSGSFDPDGRPARLRFAWRFVALPVGSALTHADIRDAATATPRFTPDVEGAYVLRLTVSDRQKSDADNVLIEVVVNRPPDAVDDKATTTRNMPVTIAVLANDTDLDNDPLKVTSVTQGAHGTVAVNPDGTVTYTPNPNFLDPDAFSYTISDGQGGTDTARVTVMVVCPPPTITAINRVSGPAGTEVTIAGTDFDCGTTRLLALSDVSAVITSFSPTEIKTFIPLGGQDGLFMLTTIGGKATASPEFRFDVVLSRDFSLAVAPADATVIQGSSTTYRVSASGTAGFSDLISLSVAGLPSGVSGGFSPGTITAGQSAMLVISAADTATLASVSLTITGTARIDASEVRRPASANLTVIGKGQTALVGRVLDTDGLPIRGVAIRVGDKTALTDENGNFLLLDPPVGEQTVFIDGGPASTPDTPYPTIPINMTIVAGQTNELPYVPHLHVQKNFNFTPIHPTQETIASDPEMPGIALLIPAGTQIIGWDGQPNTMISIRTVPVDRLPVPPPPLEVSTRTVYMFYFGKQGGGVPTQPIPFVAPNDLGLAPGEKADLWYFDESPNPGEAPNDWRMAGTGTVSADGQTIVTDPGVGIPRFCCGAVAWNDCRSNPQNCPQGPSSPQLPGDTPKRNQGAPAGDPVDLSTGIFIYTAIDLVLPGRIPVAITRTYRSGDSLPGPFGIGTTMSYDDFLQQTNSDIFTYVYEGNARTQFFRQPDGSYINTTVPAFRGARITVGTDRTRTLRFKDGTALVFDTSGLPIRLRDRNRNEVVIKREVETNPTTIIEPSGRALHITWQILARDRATAVTDPFGRTVRYEYDGQNRLVRVINPEGGMTQYTYDDQHRMTSITDPRGITFLRNTYDVNSRVCEQEQADGGKFRFYYITADQASRPESTQLLAEATAGGPISMPPCAATSSRAVVVATVLVNPRGYPTTYRFNGDGFLISLTDALGFTATFERKPGTNLVRSITRPSNRKTSFRYDDLGNTTEITNPDGSKRLFSYEPNFSQVHLLTDELEHATERFYDGRGNVIRIENALDQPTSFEYDGFGQVTAVTDALNNRFTFTHDSVGNLVTIIDPLGNRTIQVFDRVSRMTSQTDPQGRTTQFRYNDFDQVVALTDPQQNEALSRFDANTNLVRMQDAQGHCVIFTYDEQDRLQRRYNQLNNTCALDAGLGPVFDERTYDLNGNLTHFVNRRGEVSTFTYDALDRLIQVDRSDGTTTEYAYDAAGNVLRIVDTAGGLIERVFDERNRLLQEMTAQGAVSYAYDFTGRRTEMRVTGLDPTSYGYDDANRLISVTREAMTVTIDRDPLER